MATLRKEIAVRTTVGQAWDVMRHIGALHSRPVPGFVLDTKLQPGARVVTRCERAEWSASAS
jgi:hypothetical protein